MKYRNILILTLALLLTGWAAGLPAQQGEGEANTSDDGYTDSEEMMEAVTESLFPGFLEVVIPTEQNRMRFELEGGAAFTGYSDVRVPGDGGTLFSLSEDLEAEVAPAWRVRISKKLGERHNLSALAALLSVRSKGEFDTPVSFAGADFGPSDGKITGYYWFNSYRLTYRYDLVNNSRTEFGIGFTAKLREAGIRLKSTDKSAALINVGFVPIINFRYSQYLLPKLNFLLEGDALAAPQGRAEDIYAGVSYRLAPWARVKLGYRILEGGADVDKTYNFALFHYAVTGIEFGY